ncbi:MAG: adenylate/guanylate cyclase domain-containing protein [Defluviitaleaceae bacterium]|nr:adenylate/guanylate cyclase domain-containing protein [Defluviitaleaceae bacterium]
MKAKTIKRLVSIGVAIFLMYVLVFTSLFESVEYRVQDAAFQWPGVTHYDIMVIGIDERALAKFDRWPWPRHVMAEAIHILNSDPSARPAVIAIDVMFSEEDRLSPEGDAALVAAARSYDNILMASSFVIGIDRDTLSLEPVVTGIDKPFPTLLPYVRHGIVNGIHSNDGFIRDALLWERVGGERVYSFPVMAAKMYLRMHETSEFVQNNAEMYLRFTGEPGDTGNPGCFFMFSFAEIFEEDFDPALVQDAIVLIGPYAIGMMDHYQVAITHGAHMYGVEIHANTVQALLEGMYTLRATPLLARPVIIAIILLALAVGELLKMRHSLIAFAAASVSYLAVALYFFFLQGLVLPLFAPLFALIFIAIYQLIYSYVLQEIEKSKLRKIFEKYVDPKLVNELIKSGEAEANTAGKKKDIAVVFVDVRGFTPMTEALRDTPEIIVQTLNEYLELTTDSVFKNGGSIDKFIGDATMALFNGFVPLEDYVYRSVKSAWDMVQGADAVNQTIKEKFGIEIGFGIGIHCGEAIVGNLGSEFRKDYTAIGDTVNTAARLESNAKKSQVLISRDVYDLLGDRITASSIGEVPLKGKSIPMELFELTGVK